LILLLSLSLHFLSSLLPGVFGAYKSKCAQIENAPHVGHKLRHKFCTRQQEQEGWTGNWDSRDSHSAAWFCRNPNEKQTNPTDFRQPESRATLLIELPNGAWQVPLYTFTTKFKKKEVKIKQLGRMLTTISISIRQ